MNISHAISGVASAIRRNEGRNGKPFLLYDGSEMPQSEIVLLTEDTIMYRHKDELCTQFAAGFGQQDWFIVVK